MEKEVLENWLIERIAAEIEVEPRIIDAETPLYIYLMNGFQSFGVVTDLEKRLRRKLSPSILYEHETISALAKNLTPEENTYPKKKRMKRKAVLNLFTLFGGMFSG